MNQILIIDQPSTTLQQFEELLVQRYDFKVHLTDNLEEGHKIIQEVGKDEIALCMINWQVCHMNKNSNQNYAPYDGIPTIVVTGSLQVQFGKVIQSKNIVDYIYDYRPHNLEYISQLVGRLLHNKEIKVLVVDDVALTRRLIGVLLTNNRFQVFEANNGKTALEILEKHPDIRLMVTDYEMPKMDGFQLTSKAREQYSKDRLAIIGMSSSDQTDLAVGFLKNGANDYILKPFNLEEFQCRVMQNIQFIENMNTIREASQRDYLSGLYNRRYFYDVGEKLFYNAKRENLNLRLAMIDIDFFKKINDQYGHKAGDDTIKKFSDLLVKICREGDVVARVGGEEFAILTVNAKDQSSSPVFERLMNETRKLKIPSGKDILSFTISMGISSNTQENLEAMIRHADQLLYEAKNQGRDQICSG